MAGTAMVRTTKVSSRTPTPMTKPPWTTVVVLENSQVSDVFCTQNDTIGGSGDTGTKVRPTGWG
jgi:hypothetical protein